MPLFSKSQPATAPAPIIHDEKPRRSLFGGSKHETTSPTAHTTTNNHHSSAGGGGGLFNRSHEDSSITDARQRVAAAEASERDADRALNQARRAVRDARAHVKRLEHEAQEEARLAKIKQKQASDLGKRGKMLGRHGV